MFKEYEPESYSVPFQVPGNERKKMWIIWRHDDQTYVNFTL